MGRFVILSGPSCVGKGPLCKALKKFYPQLAGKLQPLILYNSRTPRPEETDGVDYHFRSRDEIERLRDNGRFVAMDVRGDLQAVDMECLESDLDGDADLLFEGNPFVGRHLLDSAVDAEAHVLSAFLAPLSKEEVEYLDAPERNVSLPDFVFDVMRRKLLRRTKKQKANLSLPDLEEIERRAGSAYDEIKLAWRFEHVIPNHDGEDSENWDAFYYPVGDARRSLLAFAGLLENDPPEGFVEKWDEGLLA